MSTLLVASLVAVACSGCQAIGEIRRASEFLASDEPAASPPAPALRADRSRARRREAASCKSPPPGARWVPAVCNHAPIQYLRQYPVLRLASPSQRRSARLLMSQVVVAAEEGNWRDLRAVARAGYSTSTARREPGDRSIQYFHAERPPEPRPQGTINLHRPKALIFANAPGRRLVLVGAMWSTRPYERGPTVGGPITRWHSHLLCSDRRHRGIKPPAKGMCSAGLHLHQGRVEMMHVWFTGELRSAFAIRAPEPELCAAGLLPAGCGGSG